ncbi:sensor histidine kinase [Streptomyces sp. NPDC087300]|uniref:sensor histidine kinase n=1 Tax=Streptomyces sp. NPDC087300 TaxID=3365780 RepID=UPI0037FE59F1
MGRDYFPPVPPVGRTRPSRGDVVLAVVATGLEVLAYVLPGPAGPTVSTGPAGGGSRVTVLGVLLIVSFVIPLALRRLHPVPALGAVLAVQLAANVGVAADPGTPMTHSYGAATCIALYTAARYAGPRAVGVGAVVCLVVQWVRDTGGAEPFAMTATLDTVFTVIVVAVGLGVRQWKLQLDINRELLADHAVAEERRRIARELHDIVAHHITTMYLMSGGARSTLDRDPETARDALMTLEESGRTALREMRQLLGVLRSSDTLEETPSEPQPGVDGIERLVADATAAGLPAELHVTGEPRPLPMTVGLTLYRITQEALTNARKHAGPARATVRLAYQEDRVTVTVTDDGAGDSRVPGVLAKGGGYGLLGMRERVALHDGTLRAGSRAEGGFEVSASVPVPAPVPTGRSGGEGSASHELGPEVPRADEPVAHEPRLPKSSPHEMNGTR